MCFEYRIGTPPRCVLLVPGSFLRAAKDSEHIFDIINQELAGLGHDVHIIPNATISRPPRCC